MGTAATFGRVMSSVCHCCQAKTLKASPVSTAFPCHFASGEKVLYMRAAFPPAFPSSSVIRIRLPVSGLAVSPLLSFSLAAEMRQQLKGAISITQLMNTERL